MFSEGPNTVADLTECRKRAAIFFSIICMGSLIQYLYGWSLHYFAGYSYSYTGTFFYPEDRFMDFFNPAWDATRGAASSYAPFATAVAAICARFIDLSGGAAGARYTTSGIVALASMILVFAASIAIIAKQAADVVAKSSGTGARVAIFLCIFFSMLISYPVVFTIDRGNYVALTFACLTLFMVFQKKVLLSAFWFAAALSLKYYLGLLIIPFFLSRNYMFIGYSLIWMLVLNFAGLVFLHAGQLYELNLMRHLVQIPDAGMSGYSALSLGRKMQWSPHLLNLFYLFVYPLKDLLGTTSDYVTHCIERAYMVLVFLPGALIGPWVIRKWVQDTRGYLFYVLVLTILIAPFIGNYTLVYLLIFVPYLIRMPNAKVGDISCLLLALCLMPKCYVNLFTMGSSTITLQSFLNPILLTALLLTPILVQRAADGCSRQLDVPASRTK